MDASYDAEKAAFEARRETELVNEKHTHVSRLTEKDGWEDWVEVLKLENPVGWRMVKVTADDSEKQEMVEEYQLHIQGILEDKRVPPIRGENNSQKKKQHLRQSVTLGAFNSTKFKEDVEHIMDVVALFARHVPGIQQTGIMQVGDKTMIEVGNRIFTPRHEAPGMQAVEVDRLVDENGYIGQVNRMDPGFVYGDENVVFYGEEKTDVEGAKRIIDISPQKLHVGDIVDVGFGVMGIGKGRDTKARLVLRNVTLLDATHTQAWLKLKAKNQLTVKNVGPVLVRRKRPGQEEDEEDTRKKMTRMSIGGVE
ncbi:hypothetical protein F5878DRAFT_702341 [Lentinula raphanica]|uniref:Uncharacterized protein n=1 Tax=Lentinula raphanica TaxID=153919 RepID=A0AA38PF92_9AGAR|nr:hypothetical protein F5878DRAFT_702341 [Lentinula raphanica]